MRTLSTLMFVVPLAAALLGAAERLQGEDQMQRAKDDVLLLIGGHFSPDHIGPDRYAEVNDRAVKNAKLYIKIFREEYLGENFDCKRISGFLPLGLLQLAAKTPPEDAKAAATDLRRDINNCLFLYDLAQDKNKLLEAMTDEEGRMIDRLKRLRTGLDMVLVK